MGDLWLSQLIGGALAAILSAAVVGVVKWLVEMKRQIDVLFERHNELAERFHEAETRRNEVCQQHLHTLKEQQATLHRLDINVVRLCEKNGADYTEK